MTFRRSFNSIAGSTATESGVSPLREVSKPDLAVSFWILMLSEPALLFRLAWILLSAANEVYDFLWAAILISARCLSEMFWKLCSSSLFRYLELPNFFSTFKRLFLERFLWCSWRASSSHFLTRAAEVCVNVSQCSLYLWV